MTDYKWDRYCEHGYKGCMSTVCGCTDSFQSRYANARARGLSKFKAWWYAFRNK